MRHILHIRLYKAVGDTEPTVPGDDIFDLERPEQPKRVQEPKEKKPSASRPNLTAQKQIKYPYRKYAGEPLPEPMHKLGQEDVRPRERRYTPRERRYAALNKTTKSFRHYILLRS